MWLLELSQIQIFIQDSDDNLVCGGTIVANDKIVSSASCFWDGKEDTQSSLEMTGKYHIVARSELLLESLGE